MKLISIDQTLKINRFILNTQCTRNRSLKFNKKHLKNGGPIRHCEPPHAHSPGVASSTVARRLCIDVHDDNDDNNDNDHDNA